jgi:glycosyltransferase involved in cell wall biosynthesis
MRILLYNWKDLAHPAAGGAEVYTHRIAEEWVRNGHEVTLFCSAVPGRPSKETVQGVRVIRRGSRLGVYREARQYWDQHGNGNFDLVVDEVNTRPFLTPTFVQGTPVVGLIHQVCREIWWYEAPVPAAIVGRFWLERHWLKHYKQVPVLTVSESSRASLEKYGLRRIKIVPEGTDHHPRPDVPKESAPTVLFVGRLSRNKRPHHAIRAFKLLRERLPHANMWVVGDGPMREQLERLRLPDVAFLGRVGESEKRELMARAHVLVVTSVREGWGLVVDEASSMGTPAMGYDVAGLRDSLSAAGGELVDPRPTALSEALAQFFLGPPRPAPSGGGAVSWSQVATEVLRNATSHDCLLA